MSHEVENLDVPQVGLLPEVGIDTQIYEENESESPKIMRVRKRNGTLEPVNVNKIVNVVIACSTGLKDVDPMRVATKVISGLYDGASTAELDQLCIQTASLLIGEEPSYSKLSVRLLARFIDEEVSTQNIRSFHDSMKLGMSEGLISEERYEFIKENKEALNIIVDETRTRRFEYFGLRTVYDRYLLKHPASRKVIETPQYFFLRVACGLACSFEEAKEVYELLSSFDYMTSSPTLFNSATQRPQMSSCYLLDSPQDNLESIYRKYTDIALLSKFSGGIGVSFSRLRSRGSLIKGTNGYSNGLIPWLKTLDSSVQAVNQGGRRKGAACVYLECWHADVEEFLQIRNNTGNEAQRTHNLNMANWIPDLFMKRVQSGELWSLFDPKEVPYFVDTFGESFEKVYLEAEKKGRFVKQVAARDLYARMMKTLAETGNGWMTFKDASNKKSNQTGNPENVIHLSNLCTEILEVTSCKETAVCNLGSLNLSNHVVNGKMDYEKLKTTVSLAIKYLDRVIDINFYPIHQSSDSNVRWRPVGLGLMGLQDVFFKLGYPFDSDQAREISRKVSEEVYFQALDTSCELAQEKGAHKSFKETRAARGELQFDSWGVEIRDPARWETLRQRIVQHGLRNSLMIAIAPTATIASIVGVCEAVEPQLSNLFKRETLSGEFIQINKYLVTTLKKLGLWDEQMRNKIKSNEGSIQSIENIPENVRKVFRTVWELPQRSLIEMAADRGAFIDQSQSLNLFMESPTIGKLSSMYMYAWEKGLKTTYYLRSRPATRIAQVTTSHNDSEAICSIENPETCEACQ